MSPARNGQVSQVGLRLWCQWVNRPARQDIQSELAQADRYVHSTEGIQKTDSEPTFERVFLRGRCALQRVFHKKLLNHLGLRVVSSHRLFQSASDKTKS